MDSFFLPRGKPRVSKNVCSEQLATLVSSYLIRAVEPAPELGLVGGYTCATTEPDAPKKDELTFILEVCSRKISIKVGVSASISALAKKPARAHARRTYSEPPYLQS